MENKSNLDNLLGNDEVTDYVSEEYGGLDMESLEQIYANYINGNLKDFKEALNDGKTLAQFLQGVIETGNQNDISKMLKILSQ